MVVALGKAAKEISPGRLAFGGTCDGEHPVACAKFPSRDRYWVSLVEGSWQPLKSTAIGQAFVSDEAEQLEEASRRRGMRLLQRFVRSCGALLPARISRRFLRPNAPRLVANKATVGRFAAHCGAGSTP